MHASFPEPGELAVLGSGFRDIHKPERAPPAARRDGARPGAPPRRPRRLGRGRIGDHLGLAARGGDAATPRRLSRGVLHRLRGQRVLLSRTGPGLQGGQDARAAHVARDRRVHPSRACSAFGRWTSNHSADRRYYMARNDTVMLREYGRLPFRHLGVQEPRAAGAHLQAHRALRGRKAREGGRRGRGLVARGARTTRPAPRRAAAGCRRPGLTIAPRSDSLALLVYPLLMDPTACLASRISPRRSRPPRLLMTLGACSHHESAGFALRGACTPPNGSGARSSLPTTRTAQKPISDHLPKVDPASQAARLRYWQDMLAQARCDSARASSRRRSRSTTMSTGRRSQTLIASQRFRDYEMPANSDTTFWTDIGYTARRPFRSCAGLSQLDRADARHPALFPRTDGRDARRPEARLHAAARDACEGRDASITAVTEATPRRACSTRRSRTCRGIADAEQAGSARRGAVQ